MILSPGYGTSEVAFTLDTTDTNFPEYLFEHGYDVWVFDYRASPALPSAGTQFTFDDVARYDFPAAVRTVQAATGAASVQTVAHCMSAMALQRSLGLGLQGVRSMVASQVSLHLWAAELNEFRSDLHGAEVLDLLEKPESPVELSAPEVRERVLSGLAQEARLMLDEGVVAAPEDLDLAMITGAGFSFWNGGLTMLLDIAGISEKVNGTRFH